jgi:peroxiredoxin
MLASCIKEDIRGADLAVGDPLPGFEVLMNDGSVVSDESLKGNVSVVIFFNTTCPDCQKVLPVVQEIYDEYCPKGVRFAVISREDTSENIKSYWEKNALNMPYSVQKTRKVYEKFARSAIPRIYINDKNGVIRYIYTDESLPLYSQLDYAVDLLMNLKQKNL